MALAAPLSLPAATNGAVIARIGQTVTVGGLHVTPLRVLEDSRCPATTLCVWAGQVRISARISMGQRGVERELTLGKPVQLASGQLLLAQVAPERAMGGQPRPMDYRFSFGFAPGRSSHLPAIIGPV